MRVICTSSVSSSLLVISYLHSLTPVALVDHCFGVGSRAAQIGATNAGPNGLLVFPCMYGWRSTHSWGDSSPVCEATVASSMWLTYALTPFCRLSPYCPDKKRPLKLRSPLPSLPPFVEEEQRKAKSLTSLCFSLLPLLFCYSILSPQSHVSACSSSCLVEEFWLCVSCLLYTNKVSLPPPP